MHRNVRNAILMIVGIAMIAIGAYGYFIARDAQANRPAAVEAGWQLRFADEFDAAALDAKKWTTCYYFGEMIDGQLRCALGDVPTGLNEPDNVTIADGAARLEVARERREALGRVYEYTFGMLSSFDTFTFTHGYAEIRAKVPSGNGLWPAFWLMPASKAWPPEIDVFEYLGKDPNIVHGTLHYNDDAGVHRQIGAEHKGDDLSKDFHVFAVKWTPGEIIWYIDGQQYHRADKRVPDVPMYLLVTSGAGWPGSWGGEIDVTTPIPSYYVVDYVRVYAAP